MESLETRWQISSVVPLLRLRPYMLGCRGSMAQLTRLRTIRSMILDVQLRREMHWRRNRGGQGGHVPPTFQSGGQRYVCAPPPLSDPEFRDVPPPPPHILSRSYAVEMGLYLPVLDLGMGMRLRSRRCWDYGVCLRMLKAILSSHGAVFLALCRMVCSSCQVKGARR